MLGKQIFTIIDKNFLLLWRNKCNLIKELALPLITSGLILLQNEEGLVEIMKFLLPLYLPGSVNGFMHRHLINFVNDKNERFKEIQKVMGLTQKAYLGGWLLTCYIKGFIVAFITLAAVYYADLGQQIGFLKITLAFYLYMFAAVHQTFAISTFFNSPKLAGEVGGFVMQMSSMLYYYLTLNFDNKNNMLFYFSCLFPQPAIAFAMMPKIFPMAQQYSVESAIWILAFDIFLYLGLYYWLDQILPNEYGIRKSACFCLRRKNNQLNKQGELIFQPLIDENIQNVELQQIQIQVQGYENNQGKKNQQGQQQISINELQGPSIINQQQLESSAKYFQKIESQQQKKVSVVIKELCKNFESIIAVNKLSLSIYENQILCLLGHNGAGKTTCINLLTGMIEKSQGVIQIYGKELESNLEDMRQQIGLCTQKDILYEDLTVDDHLKFFCSIKGMEGVEQKEEVDVIIEKVGLTLERQKQVKQLSGGNKRKLSLGIALTGGAKLIFLDEPTSGMDPVSRRAIWDILEQIKKENRTIVLTTHHLDEAEILSDRIAIMNKGELLIDGTSDFIKKNFGIGYHLIVNSQFNKEMEFNQTRQQIKQQIQTIISDVRFDDQVAKTTIKAILPFSSQAQFAQLFEELEKNQDIIINVEMNSLEEAFVNIGLEDNQNQLPAFEQLREHIKQFVAQPSQLNQTIAMFKRQAKLIYRNWQSWLMFLFPIILIYIGVLIGKQIMNFQIEDENNKNDDQDSINNLTDGIKLIMVGIFIVQAYCINSSVYISTPVQEQEQGLKYILKVMGCNSFSYWFGTFCFDYLIFIITYFFFALMVYSYEISFIQHYITEISLILITFGASLITFSYLCSFMFNKTNTAFKWFPAMNMLIGYTLPLIFQAIFMNINEYCYIFIQIASLILSPFHCLDKCISNITKDFQWENQLFDNYKKYLTVLALQIPFYALLIALIQRWQLRQNSISNYTKEKLPQQVNGLQDEEGVANEGVRVRQRNNQDTIKVIDLHKIYPKNSFHALKGISFGVEKGQIFGLLGPNGAGKSTCFNILTTNIPKSYGELYLNQTQINQNYEFNNNLGICPQSNALWDLLTPQEHLELFANIKGVRSNEIDEIVKYYLKALQLDAYENKAINLSGGNKRKLCVANSLIGSPNIGFFDEPSTGLDPIAKRFLWNILTLNLKERESSIMFTTHSLAEAESICHKIGILINGKFICLDMLQLLKNKFGKGIRIKIRLLEGKQNQQHIHFLMKQAFEKAEKLVDDNGIMDYQIPIENFSFKNAFQLLQGELKQKNLIEDFSISQASLEQIFLHFSKDQLPENHVENQQ